jgi:curved DNA-binding protein
MEYKDYYAILGVPKDANEKTIKQAYRKLARTHHPDVNPGDPQAEQRFKEINEAYTVLSDGEKRKMYDRFGTEWEQYQRAGVGPDDMPYRTGPSGQRVYQRTISPEEFEAIFGRGFGSGLGGFGEPSGGEFSDFFEALFGGARGGPRTSARPRPRRGRDVETDVEITLEEALHGTSRTMQWSNGQRIEVDVPPGVTTGSRVRISGQGQPGSGGSPPGDLYLNITVLPHSEFRREGDNLRVKVAVDLYTAILGGEVQVPTLERPVMLSIPEGTQNDRTFRLKSLGMPNLRNPKQRGDLYAEIDVKLPTNITAEKRQLFQRLRDMERIGH